jgi:hypothetical protein
LPRFQFCLFCGTGASLPSQLLQFQIEFPFLLAQLWKSNFNEVFSNCNMLLCIRAMWNNAILGGERAGVKNMQFSFIILTRAVFCVSTPRVSENCIFMEIKSSTMKHAHEQQKSANVIVYSHLPPSTALQFWPFSYMPERKS